MEIKEKLQKFFDKEIISISENGSYYYVTLDDGLFVKPIYRVDLENKIIETNTVTVPKLHTFKLIYSKDSGINH